MVTENITMHLSKSEYQSNVSFIQLGDDSTGLRMGCLTRSKAVNYTQPLFIVLSFPVLEERDARGRFICVQCVLSPLVL